MAIEETTGTDLSVAMITDPVAVADWLVIAPVALPLIFGAVLLMLRHRTAVQPGLAIAALAILFAVFIVYTKVSARAKEDDNVL